MCLLIALGITKNPWTINGWFYRYDFEKDGKCEYNDWLYVSQKGKVYRLLGTTPTEHNAFGWLPLSSIPSDVGEPAGYFIFLDYPQDSDRRFSWLYLSKNGKVYKLIGADPVTHRFKYLDIDGDGKIDSLSGLDFIQQGENRIEFIDLSCVPGAVCDSASSSLSSQEQSSSSLSSHTHSCIMGGIYYPVCPINSSSSQTPPSNFSSLPSIPPVEFPQDSSSSSIESQSSSAIHIANDYIDPDPIKQKTLYPGHYPGMHANDYAFAVLRKDGSVVTWGDPEYGGDSSKVQDKLHNVVAIYSADAAFAALREDGNVVTWGKPEWGGNSSTVQDKLHNVVGFSPSFVKQ